MRAVSSRLALRGCMLSVLLLGCADPIDPGSDGTSGATGGTASAGSGGSSSLAGTGSGLAPSGGGGAGGSSASGGAAGASGNSSAGSATESGGGGAGGAPHEVGACDGLGEVDEFQDITPPGVLPSDYGVTNMLLDPIHSGTIWAGTDHQGLFKSTNCGKDWQKISTGRGSETFDQGLLWSMAIDFTSPDVMYTGSAQSSNDGLFKSTNGGVDWDPLWDADNVVSKNVQYSFFQDISMDPGDPKHIIVSFHAQCFNEYAPMCMGETTDSGATWRLVKVNLPGGDSWSEGTGPFHLGGPVWVLATLQNGVFYTSDSGATWEKVAQGADHSLYRATDGSYYTGSDYGINHSVDGHTWTTVPSSPHGYGMGGDGKRLFNSLRYADGSGQSYFTSPEDDGVTWTPLASPDMTHGAVGMAYDPDHHLLYSVNTGSGLWRVVTQ